MIMITTTEQRETFKSPGQILRELGVSPSNSLMNRQNPSGGMSVAAREMEAFPTTSSSKIGQILISKKIITESDLHEAMARKRQQPKKYLGQILCEMGIPQSKIIKTIYFSNKRKKLGEILVENKIITDEQLKDTLIKQRHQKSIGMHKHLGTMLTLSNTITEVNYINALSAHFSMPVVSLKNFKVSSSLQKAIGEQYALKNRIVVLSNTNDKLTVAIAEPHLSIFEYLEKAMPKGKHILFCQAKASEIEKCLNIKYDPFHMVLYR
jgi:hypothetical protein